VAKEMNKETCRTWKEEAPRDEQGGILRSIKTLGQIIDKPAQEFWKEVAKRKRNK